LTRTLAHSLKHSLTHTRAARPHIQFHQDGAVATITLERPPVNALDAPTI